MSKDNVSKTNKTNGNSQQDPKNKTQEVSNVQKNNSRNQQPGNGSGGGQQHRDRGDGRPANAGSNRGPGRSGEDSRRNSQDSPKPVQNPSKSEGKQARSGDSGNQTAGRSDVKSKSGTSAKQTEAKALDHVTHEVVSIGTARDICRRDANINYPEDVRKNFVASNMGQYYVLVNIWLLMICEVKGEWIKRKMIHALQSFGLAALVNAASEAADILIASTKGVSHSESSDLTLFFLTTFCQIDVEDPEQLGQALQLLRFPKRLTVSGAPWLAKASEDKLAAVIRRNNYGLWRKDVMEAAKNGDPHATMDPDPDSDFSRLDIGFRVKKYLARMWRTFSKRFKEVGNGLSSGTCSDAKTQVDKVLVLASQMPCLEPMYPLSDNSYSRISTQELVVKPIPVPKNYKSYRMIAPESVRVSYNMQRVRKALELAMKDSGFDRYFNVHTQEPNRTAAQEGSISGQLVTLDLTSASDSIRRKLAHDVYPADVWAAVEEYLPRKIDICGQLVYPSTFLTSGNPITFIGEGALFVAIVLACRDIYNESPFIKEKIKVDPIIFGDDIIIPYELLDTVLEMLDYLGFVVNEEKSFWEGKYRESCGVEYYHGIPCDSKYWPRRYVSIFRGGKINCTAEGVASLVSLQHRLYKFTNAALFIEAVVLLLQPKMTYSFVGLDTDDLWSEFPNPRLRARYIEKVNTVKYVTPNAEELSLREQHLTLTTTEGSVKNLKPEVAAVLERYDFYQYMQTGPQYPDKLSELLRVSDPPRRVTPKGASHFEFIYR